MPNNLFARAFNLGFAIVATAVLFPVMLVLVCITFLGMVFYLPYHLWTICRPSESER
jgi:lipopolysaccharide/colanic/teichoic acid biosynthesis glycosyltransferase